LDSRDAASEHADQIWSNLPAVSIGKDKNAVSDPASMAAISGAAGPSSGLDPQMPDDIWSKKRTPKPEIGATVEPREELIRHSQMRPGHFGRRAFYAI
jgi:hypothetical protein